MIDHSLNQSTIMVGPLNEKLNSFSLRAIDSMTDIA